MSKKILLIAALVTGLYVCAYVFPWGSYSFRSKVALIGTPGLLVAVVISSALRGGGHGGGPAAEMMIISTVVNFSVYVALGAAGRAVWKLLNRK